MSSFLTGTVKRLSLLYRILAMLVTATLIVVIFPHTQHAMRYDYKVGAVWRNADLTAPYDFAVIKSSDELRAEQEAERQKAILYYREDSSARDVALARLESGRWGLASAEKRQMKRQMFFFMVFVL